MTGAQHARIVDAMTDVVAEHGFAGVTVRLVTERAGVSSRTFYEHFENLEDCFSAVLDLGLAQGSDLIADAFADEDRWEDGVRAALAAALAFLDSEPLLARVWLVESMAAGSNALDRRERIVAQLTSMIVDRWSDSAPKPPDPLAVAGAMASVLGLIHSHLVTSRPTAMIELLGPLMGLVTAPYLGRRDAARESERGEQLARALLAGDPARSTQLAGARPLGVHMSKEVALRGVPRAMTPGVPTAHRARECLLLLAARPGSSNRDIAEAIGVRHQSQISKLLASLAEKNLAAKRSEGAGKRNAWRLTAYGEQIVRSISQQRDQTPKVGVRKRPARARRRSASARPAKRRETFAPSEHLVHAVEDHHG
jgi:AcrR family transcriptional regulator/DNA-binding MarR family transcriptional regulator